MIKIYVMHYLVLKLLSNSQYKLHLDFLIFCFIFAFQSFKFFSMADQTQFQIETENTKGCGDKYGFGCALDILFVLMVFAIPVFSIIALFKSDTKWKVVGGVGLGFSALIFYTIYGNRNSPSKVAKPN